MAVIVEYLLIIQKAGTFCDSIKSFNRLLTADSSISIKAGKVTYDETREYDYAITSGDISGKDQKYFHLRFTCDAADEEDINIFSTFLRNVRSAMNRAGGQPETLWDDISWHYSEQAYAMIYRVENLMRKLIANFMLVTIGKEWVTETSPAEVKEAMAKGKRKDYLNVLHTIDFIHLADFLLKPYSTKAAPELHALFDSAATVEELNDLKKFIPRSNWAKYFSTLVPCNDDYIRARWSELYELRCKVAHNAIIVRDEFHRIIELVGDVTRVLEEAIKKLPQVSVPEADVNVLAENAASNLSSLVGEFIGVWRDAEMEMRRIRGGTASTPWSSVHEVLHQLRVRGALSVEEVDRISELRMMRNHITHPTGISLSEDELKVGIHEMTTFLRVLKDT